MTGFGRQKGVTLVEVLVVMIVLAISLAVTVPSVGQSYDNWQLRSTGRRAAAMFRSASGMARRKGSEIAGYYAERKLVLIQQGKTLNALDIPTSITTRPEKPQAVMFLPSGQIISSEPFVFANERGRSVVIEFGPLPGDVRYREERR